jgi:hypothetical protein
VTLAARAIERNGSPRRALPMLWKSPSEAPPKTDAWLAIVETGQAPESAELAEMVERLGHPDAVTREDIRRRATGDFRTWLEDWRNGSTIRHRMIDVGYELVPNPDEKGGSRATRDLLAAQAGPPGARCRRQGVRGEGGLRQPTPPQGTVAASGR